MKTNYILQNGNLYKNIPSLIHGKCLIPQELLYAANNQFKKCCFKRIFSKKLIYMFLI